MMSNFKHTFQQISGALLLTLFVGYFVGTSFFKHTHIVDGKIIVHSHPFSSTEQHSHSTNTIILLQKISRFESNTIAKVFQFVTQFEFLRVIADCYRQPDLIFYFHYQNFLRPPPSV